jgi:hypothetical protein
MAAASKELNGAGTPGGWGGPRGLVENWDQLRKPYLFSCGPFLFPFNNVSVFVV